MRTKTCLSLVCASGCMLAAPFLVSASPSSMHRFTEQADSLDGDERGERGACEPGYVHGFAGDGPDVDFTTPSIFAITIWDDGNGPALYIGGFFSSIDGVPARNIAKWDGQSWSALGEGVGSQGSGPVRKMLPFDDGTGEKLYVVGGFDQASNVPGTERIAAWDGVQWLSTGAPTQNMAGNTFDAIVGDLGNGPEFFLPAGRTVYRYNGTTWTNTFTNINAGGFAYAMEIFSKNGVPHLYIGGKFDTINNGGQARNIARFNGSSWSSAGQFNQFGDVRSLKAFDDGTGMHLYAGGIFTVVGSIGANRIARLPAAGTGHAWEAMGSGLGGYAGCPSCQLMVDDMTIFDDGSGPALYIGGNFQTVNGVTSPHIAKWKDGAWHAVGSIGVSGGGGFVVPIIYAMTSAPGDGCSPFTDDGSSVLFFGGHFDAVEGEANNYLAKLQGCAPDVLPGDLNGDGVVDLVDLLSLLAAWGPCNDPCRCAADFNGDGTIDLQDLLVLLANWG